MEEADCSQTETEIEDGKTNNAAATDDDKPVSVHSNLRRLSGPTRRSSKANWTEEEDDILRAAVQKYEGKSWKKIAGCLPGRTDVQCLHRWQKVINPDLVKGPWSKEEDGILVELVGRFGEKKWSEIAEQLPGRMGKQCRERWYNHLMPEINKAAWTDEEERVLINAHAEYGNKWSTLAKLLPGRTENSVKNHWNCSLKKKLCNYSASGSTVNRPRPTIPPLQANNKGVTRDSTEANQTQKPLETVENQSTIYACKEPVDRGSNGESRNIEILKDSSKTWDHAQGCTSVDDDDPPETSPRSSNGDACGKLEGGSSERSYTGLCYEPVQWDIFLCSPSQEALDSYRSTRWMLRTAAMRYPNMPSIIRKRAFQPLHKGDHGVGALCSSRV